MSTNTDITDAEGWQGLPEEEQHSILNERLADADLQDDEGFSFTEPTFEQNQSAAALIEQKTQETWHGTVLDDVVMEYFTLQEKHITMLKEMAGLFARIKQADSKDDLSQQDLDTLQEADEELEQMLSEVCVQEPREDGPDAFSLEWWQAGEYPAPLKMDVFGNLFEKFNEGGDQVKNSH